MVEFLLLVYNTQTDEKPLQVLALDNFVLGKLAPGAQSVQLKRRDGGSPVYLHGTHSLLQQWCVGGRIRPLALGAHCRRRTGTITCSSSRRQ